MAEEAYAMLGHRLGMLAYKLLAGFRLYFVFTRDSKLKARVKGESWHHMTYCAKAAIIFGEGESSYCNNYSLYLRVSRHPGLAVFPLKKYSQKLANPHDKGTKGQTGPLANKSSDGLSTASFNGDM